MAELPCICGRVLDQDSVPFWVQCDRCQRWLHGPCTSFKSDEEAQEHSEDYWCPPCLKARKATFVAVDRAAVASPTLVSSPVPNLPRPGPSPPTTPSPSASTPPTLQGAAPTALKIRLKSNPSLTKPASPNLDVTASQPGRAAVPRQPRSPQPGTPASPMSPATSPTPRGLSATHGFKPDLYPAASPGRSPTNGLTPSPRPSPDRRSSPAKSPQGGRRSPGPAGPVKAESPAALKRSLSPGAVPSPAALKRDLQAVKASPPAAHKSECPIKAEPVESPSATTAADPSLFAPPPAVSPSQGSSPVRKRPKAAESAVADVDPLEDAAWLELLLHDRHAQRPLWVTPLRNGGHRIILETFSPHYPLAQHFLVTIAEPVSRTAHIHEWELTPDSLYAAVSFGIDGGAIVERLAALSKVQLHPSTVAFIEQNTQNFGKAILVLENRTFFVEGKSQEVIDTLYRDRKVREAIRQEPDGTLSPIVCTTLTTDTGAVDRVFRFPLVPDDPNQKAGVHSKARENLKRRCRELGLPLAMFYDFRADRENPAIAIDLKPTTRLRPYQEMALTKMFTNGRARSGIIVLPCGAGKTLVGVTATTTVKRRTLVLCLNTVSVEQWVHQFRMWSTVEAARVTKFTADHKEAPGDILITTFNMLSFGGERASRSEEVMEEVKNIEWGLVILDEVHVVPAETFRRVLEVVHARCILGLTATLLREDEKIDDLKFLIGPKLYEANWLELSKQGSLATVQCVEVHCPMTKEFFEEYLNAEPARKTQLYIMNPVKFWCTQALIQYHERSGDKIIVFSDSVPALREYARVLKRPFIEGRVGQAERMSVLDHFKRHPDVNTIFITKVGDTSIDLPEATVIIQISSHFGSRRQEAQRLGRILRPKGPASANSRAYFYSLISCDTREMYYCSKRQQFLLDQGYAYKVLAADVILDAWQGMVRRQQQQRGKEEGRVVEPRKLATLDEQRRLLDSVLALTSEALREDEAKREAAERSAREALRQRRAATMAMHPILRNLFKKR
eukprot:EG_transcript_1436